MLLVQREVLDILQGTIDLKSTKITKLLGYRVMVLKMELDPNPTNNHGRLQLFGAVHNTKYVRNCLDLLQELRKDAVGKMSLSTK